MVPGRVEDCTCEVKKTVSFSFSHTAREPLSQIRWNGYLPSQALYVYRDDIAEEVKFRFLQDEDLQAAVLRSRYHRGHTGPRQRTDSLCMIQEQGEGVMQRIIRTSAVGFDELLAD